MQAEHHFREAEARVVDGDAISAGERDLETAAEAEAVHDGDRRHAEILEPVRDAMRTADLHLHLPRIGRAAKRVDVGAGDEAGRFCRTDDQRLRPVLLDRGKHAVELLDHIGGQGVGAGAFAIEQQPCDAVRILRQAKMLPRALARLRRGMRPELDQAILEEVEDTAFHHFPHTASSSTAPPSPPPTHCVAMPRRLPSRFIALTRCSVMRLPLAPTG